MSRSRWRMDGYVKCPECGEENDGAAIFGEVDDGVEVNFGIFDGLTSIDDEPCYGCGKRIKVTLTCET